MTVLKRLLPAMLFVLATATVALASEGGVLHESMMTTLFRVINFVIFIALIWKFGGKAIANTFGGRRKNIETQLTELEDRKQTAAGKLADVEKSIANIEAEREEILAEFARQGETLKASIIENAQISAEKIKEQALMTAANERNAALKEIRAEVAELVIEAAEKALAGKLSADEHNKLVNDYLTKVVLN
ncbi:F0F1 ATP synthase subunit B [Desulfovibrio ferrophilus]|uniref:ATP synthase subunit b n=1 Tax=Desulfovibrio ferrophilus TaxID=241368 RepID=A0A2Z6B2D0_9BACT|nr:F0F1 ATP synthase subunit B [Desulfovibrio ferrophilus]BBD09662.1 ATP synthase subunit b [Desulfovibrio ferrophilus]